MRPDEVKFWQGCKESLKFFTTKALGLKWPSHYTEWERNIESNQRSLTEAPRGSWKTFFFSLAYPLWRILRGKTEVLLISDSEDQARKNLRLIRETIEMREELAPMRPSTKELWGTNQIEFPNGSLVHIMGFGTSRRGTHPLVMIADDIEGENNRMSREDKDRMYFGVITGMALPETKIAVVGTPIEFGDILEQLSKNPVYKHWRRPAELKGENQYRDIWTNQWLAFRHAEMGSFNYAREMLLQRVDPATQPFKREYETLYSELPARFAWTATVCDPAYSENQGDYTAIVTVGFTAGNHAYVLEAKGIRREDPGMVVNELIKSIRIWNPQFVGIEKRKGDAISYSFKEARVRHRLFDFKYVELQSRGLSKEKRINMVGGLVSRWEARAVHIHPEMKLLRDQLYAYRFNDEQSEHDDLVDALAYCFHPDIIKPNFGPSNVPLDEETASMEGKPRYQLGRGEMWRPRQVYDWVGMKSGISAGGYQWSSIDTKAFKVDARLGE